MLALHLSLRLREQQREIVFIHIQRTEVRISFEESLSVTATSMEVVCIEAQPLPAGCVHVAKVLYSFLLLDSAVAD